MAVVLSGVRHICDTVFLEAAKVKKKKKVLKSFFRPAEPLLNFTLSPAFLLLLTVLCVCFFQPCLTL